MNVCPAVRERPCKQAASGGVQVRQEIRVWDGGKEGGMDEKSGALGDVKREGGGTAKVDAQDGWLCR